MGVSHPIHSAFGDGAFGSKRRNSLPRTGLIGYWPVSNGLVDTIRLSANALWDALPAYMRPHYLSDRDTKLSDATIAANIAASGFLNVGGGLFGNSTKGYAQYADGTPIAILDKAAKYYKETYGWPTDIKSLVIASGGALSSPIGPAVAYSAAAGQVPDGLGGVQASAIAPVHSAGYYGGPAYTNKCTCRKANPTDLTNVTKSGDAASVLSVVDDSAAIAAGVTSGLGELQACTSGMVYKLDNSVGSTNAYCTVGGAYTTLNYHTHSIVARASAGVGRLMDSGFVGGVDFSNSLYALIQTGHTPTSTVKSLMVQAGAGAIVYFILPQLVQSPYLLPTISDGNAAAVSVVSTVGTITGNGVSVPLTGSDAADALKDCFEGPNGNDAVGTVAVLMRIGTKGFNNSLAMDSNVWSTASSAYNGAMWVYISSAQSAKAAMVGDGTGVAALLGPDWSSHEYHAKIVEYSGTRFRVGNQRFNEDGTEIDADIVWSHVTLADGATFDGSFNPTTFLRWFLNATVPNHMRCHFVSNQSGLGDAEIIRRLREYGSF